MRSLVTATLLFLFVASALANESTESKPKWVELSYHNFQETVQAHDWTCILLYDPWDERTLYEDTLVMEGMMDRFQARNDDRVGFARINGRQHTMLREEYTAVKVGDRYHAPNPFARDYYDSVSDSPNQLLKLNNETLLDVALGTPYWPFQFWVIHRNYNLYGSVEMNLMLGSIPLKTAVLDRWLVQAIDDKVEDMEPLVQTRANMEKELLEYNEYADNSFNFDAYDAAQEAIKEEMEDEKQEEEESEAAKPRNMRLLLETDSKDDNKVSSKGHFTYRKAKVKKVKNSDGYLTTMGTVIEEYLAWCEGYETTWSSERKAREDEQTNFGVYFKQMNLEIQALFDRVLDPNSEHFQYMDPKILNKMRINKEFAKQMEIPNLRAYFQELIFGSGRNVHRFRKVMHDMKTKLGATPEERRRNRSDFDMSTIPLVPRLREYLTVYAAVDEDEKLYSAVLADLLTDWHNLLRTFHINLNQYYLNWVAKNPRPHGNEFQFKKMDIIDMKDPANVDLLTNYDKFHETYTKSGTPVILSNVELSNQQLTMDYIVSQCAASIVTSSVQVSRKVGERQADNGWGGLGEYRLDDELATHSRRKKNKADKYSEDFDPEYELSSDSDEDDEEGIDRSLTMQQYVNLVKRLDHLYLHDYGLPDNCDRILYDDTLYNRNQKFKIPSIIASWDLFQRLPGSKYWTSWPSLFVGKKGSNSKLHIDSGATGFFMYLVKGRKRWVVYNRDERVFLYEKIEDYATYPDVLGMGKDEESDEFLSNRFPLLHRTESAYEIIQQPGQLVYIPPSCPHAVENLEDTIGIAMNIVPREGMANHFHEQIHSQMDYSVFDVAMNYWLFEDNADKPTATEDPLYTTYGEYKAQY